jgi:endonuclease/exonuclease/phosphatase family metal-dependent hydrolase
MKKLVFCLLVAVVWPVITGRAQPSPAAGATDRLTVVSLNLALRENLDRIVSELGDVGALEADVMLLQEVAQRGDGPDTATALADRLGMHAVYRQAFRLSDDLAFGQATLSRYPMSDARVLALKQFTFAFRDKDRMALAATVATPIGGVRTYNMHLDTRINLADRIEQIAPVVEEAAASSGPVIIGGDFNTNNHRWFFHTVPLPWLHRQGRGLERYMEGVGFVSAFDGTPTHDALRMRLDWVFLRGFDTSATAIVPLEMSDHHALIVSVVPGARRSPQLN